MTGAPVLHKRVPKEPGANCRRCPRLGNLRRACRKDYPDWHNGPVHAFGPLDAQLLIVGLAPGLKGANRTGRPFTGDAAGGYLFSMLAKYGFANGEYDDDADDDLRLNGVRITNAVRCLPPENKPVAAEINACRPFLHAELSAMEKLSCVLTLGKLAHDATLRTLGLRVADHPFAHGAEWRIDLGKRHIRLISSYHCSRYNTQTGRLTDQMFSDIFRKIRDGGAPNKAQPTGC